MIIKLNKQLILEASDDKYFDNIPCKGIKEKKGFSCGLSKKRSEKLTPYFIYTHRARSKGYKSLDKIPTSVINFIDSTG